MSKMGDDIPRRVSHSKKVANDFQRQKEIMDVYDMWYGDYRNYEDLDKYDVNYDLFNGRLDVSLYDDPVCINIEGRKIQFEFQSITHYPLISQVANAMWGEMISRPFQPIAKDLGSFSQTMRHKKWNLLLRELIQFEIIEPLRSEVTQAYFRDNGVIDQFQLSPQQLQQAEADINSRVQSRTPEEVLDFMQNDFQTPTQKQAQQLLDYFITHQDIKYKQDEGFKHAIITGKEIYYVGDRHGEPVFEVINPKWFTWAGSQHTEWIQDASWAKYEQWLTIEDAMQKYAEEFSRKTLKELEGFAEPIGGVRATGDPRRDPVMQKTMYEISLEDGYFAKKYGDVNYKTKEGQKQYIHLYKDIIKKYGANYGYAFSNYGIREAHITWRDKRKLKRVTQIINGEEKHFWQDEHYETQPEDVKVMTVWVDEIWEGTKIGGSHGQDLYFGIRPIPGQFKSIFNPYGNKLPYFGKCYNTHMNNSKNVSIVDLGKPWQKEFDVTMAQIKHDMATDLGNVLMLGLQAKPENWEWQDWLNTLKNGKLLFANLQKHGFSGLDPDSIKVLAMSKATDIANKVELLNYFRENMISAMNFNQTRIGSIGEYSTNQNIQQSQSASYNQTEGYFETHRKIVEKALNAFMNRARLVYKDNHKRFFILDDVTRTDLQISPEFWYEEWAVEFSTSTEDVRRVQELRQQLQAFVQNQMSFDGIMALVMAKTPADIREIMKKEDALRERMRQEEMQLRQQQQQAELEAEAREKQLDREFELEKQRQQLESQEMRTAIDIHKFRLQNDVDQNNQADTIQKALIELEVKKELEREKMKLEDKKISTDKGLKEKELKIREKEANAKIKQASKPNKN